jgi:hypothetical protein
MLRARRMGSRKRATQTGRGMRIVSTKQDVGMGEEILECGPCVYLSVHPIIISAEKQLTKPSTGGHKASPSLQLRVELKLRVQVLQREAVWPFDRTKDHDTVSIGRLDKDNHRL